LKICFHLFFFLVNGVLLHPGLFKRFELPSAKESFNFLSLIEGFGGNGMSTPRMDRRVRGWEVYEYFFEAARSSKGHLRPA